MRGGLSTGSVSSRRIWLGVLAGLALWLAPSPARAMSIRFDWSEPNPRLVNPGTTSVTVDLLADQSDGADAAFVTLGFALSGIVVDVALQAFGPAVSAADSSFGPSGNEILLLAAAPSTPGSFGTDVDFTVATLVLTLDPGLGSIGALALEDLTDFAGAPALERDGVTVVPSDLSTGFTVVVPEPSTSTLLAAALVAFGFSGRRRRPRCKSPER